MKRPPTWNLTSQNDGLKKSTESQKPFQIMYRYESICSVRRKFWKMTKVKRTFCSPRGLSGCQQNARVDLLVPLGWKDDRLQQNILYLPASTIKWAQGLNSLDYIFCYQIWLSLVLKNTHRFKNHSIPRLFSNKNLLVLSFYAIDRYINARHYWAFYLSPVVVYDFQQPSVHLNLKTR